MSANKNQTYENNAKAKYTFMFEDNGKYENSTTAMYQTTHTHTLAIAGRAYACVQGCAAKGGPSIVCGVGLLASNKPPAESVIE